MSNIEITKSLGIKSAPAVLSEDFGVITVSKQKEAEKFASSEIKQIVKEDIQKVRDLDRSKPDPFDNDLDKLYADLGI